MPEQQLAFTLGIMNPLSIPVYGMLMQVSKSVNQAARQWEPSLFENHRIAKLLSMARTTARKHGSVTRSSYVCIRTWREWHMTFCFKFYIPIRDCGKRKKKRSFKDILGDYAVHMQSIDNTQKNGVIRVELRGSYKNRNIENIL